MPETTGTLKGFDGTRLFLRRWQPAAGNGGSMPMILVHGGAEHAGRYQHIAEFFAGRGFSVWALDHRGHGKSGGAPMALQSFDDYQRDLEVLFDQVRGEAGGPPVLLGHSMGGTIALRHAVRHPGSLRALVLSSPGLRFALPVPLHLRVIAPLLSWLTPRLLLDSGLKSEDLTRDADKVAEHRRDPLVRRQATPRFYVELLRGMAAAAADSVQLQVPVLFMAGGRDRVVSPQAIREAYEQAPATDKTLRWYDDCFHELLNEPCRDDILVEIHDWLAARGGTPRVAEEAGERPA